MNKSLKVRKAVIPVAGFGTRFLPATKAMPKEMMPIVDKPVIQYIVEEAVASGFTEVIFITGRNKRALEDHFDYNYELEHLLKHKGKTDELEQVRAISEMVKVVYVRQKEALGLGHAILQARSVVGDEPFAIFLGDDIISSEKPAIAQMLEVYMQHGKSIVGVRQTSKESVSSYGVIDPAEINGRTSKVKSIVEKPDPAVAPSNLAVTGRYILDSKVFDYLEKTKPGAGDEIQITDALDMLAKNEGLMAYEYEGKYYDGGNKLEFVKATVDFAMARPEFKEELKKFLAELD